MNKLFETINLEANKPLKGLADFSRRVAAEGIVLLKNDNHVLPFNNQKISIFGRIQTDYYKSGTGSGGLVNVQFVTSILEGLLQNPKIVVNKELLNIYTNWVSDNPFNAGNGMWASEPWSQTEMPLTDEIVENAAKNSTAAVIIIGRTAGEDRDNNMGEGSYLLRKDEIEMIVKVSKCFSKTVLVLNVGNIIDMSILDTCRISSVLYVWHGGMEGGRAVSDVLCGDVNPSGKLTDTIAYSIEDYPSNCNFGGKENNIYQEDIYVGYRYFETFAPNRVRFPFGFGLSYSIFHISTTSAKTRDNHIDFHIKVKNSGEYSGKEVVQIYVSMPQGKLGKPTKQLIAFAKTPIILPKKSVDLIITVNINTLASFDDIGVTGFKSAYVLEEGNYLFYVGSNVRENMICHAHTVYKTYRVEQLSEALAPKKNFSRIKPIYEDNHYVAVYEDVPIRTINLQNRINENIPKEFIKTDNNKYLLKDVYEEKITIEQFIAQLSDYELSCIVRGEGMSSPKVTSGTAAAFGGITKELLDYGIPIACAADGPSGIRMDSGQLATSLPNGTCLACTMNYDLVKELYYLEGKELLNYKIDTLLGPGMNIHRNPLNGRNFEYFSEDPLITGMLAMAVTVGLQSAGVTGTLKHMACNNQEFSRFEADAIVSQRALREIYLKGFEIAIKAGKSRAIMTSYNPINGIWAAGNYDLNTTIVHQEWGFNGIIMTDWWAKMNNDGEQGFNNNTAAMIRAQNDLYMVVPDAACNYNQDNTLISLENKTLNRSELQRVAKNICQFLLKTPAFINANQLNISSSLYHEDSWFLVKKDPTIYPYLDGIKVNGILIEEFNFLQTTYYVKGDEDAIPNIEPIAQPSLKIELVEATKNCNVTTIKVISNNEEAIYRVIIIDKNKRRKSNAIIDMQIITPLFINVMKSGAWNHVIIDLKQPSYKTNIIQVSDQGIINACKRNEVITYALEIEASGKYIIELTVATHFSNLSQIPFSIYIDEENKSTLTMGATNGKWITINTHILIDKGLHYLSLRFGRTGLDISQIKMIKHN